MSQQTTLAAVIPYFHRWIERFPSVEVLANAPESDVLAQWAGLGYYSRARNLHRAAKVIVNEWSGVFPKSFEGWRALPGVGPYTAAALSSVVDCHGPLPMDGNVMRVFSRFLGVADPLNKVADRKKIEDQLAVLAATLSPEEFPIVAQGLMELGALVCRPGEKVRCDICPLKRDCFGNKNKTASRFPRPKRRPELQKIVQLCLIYTNPRGEVLVRERPQKERLAHQWELPTWELPGFKDGDLDSVIKQKIIKNFELLGEVRHTITKHQYRVLVLRVGRWAGAIPEGHRFVSPTRSVGGIVLTTLTRKALRYFSID